MAEVACDYDHCCVSGAQTMYSGVLGTELTAQIYMGVVYYQRLRHMVSDKFQVSRAHSSF